jgi:hypothetical protein
MKQTLTFVSTFLLGVAIGATLVRPYQIVEVADGRAVYKLNRFTGATWKTDIGRTDWTRVQHTP